MSKDSKTTKTTAKTTAKTTTKTTATAGQPVKVDVYARVTDRIIKDLEHGARPWMKPWSATNTEGRIELPIRHNGTPYRGMNVLLLWGEAVDRGFQSPQWMTYRQAHELGGQVRKGETGSLVVYADRYTKTETDEQGQPPTRSGPLTPCTACRTPSRWPPEGFTRPTLPCIGPCPP